MLREGHIGLTLTIVAPIAAVVGSLLPKYTIILILSGALTGSNLPDLDTTTRLVKHRGFTHTIWFMGLTSIIGGIIMYAVIFYMPVKQFFEYTYTLHILSAAIFGLSIGLGIVTHLLGDMITPRGIKPFSPILPRDLGSIPASEKKYVYDVRNASDPLLNKGFSVLGVAATVASGFIVNAQLF